MRPTQFILLFLLVAEGLSAQGAQERWQMRHSDVVFMYVPKTPQLYADYGCSVVLWGGGAGNVQAAHEQGVHFQSSFWFLTAGGEKLAKDPELLKAVCVDVEGKPIEVPWLTDHKGPLPNYWGCTNAPYYREYLRRTALAVTEGDFDGCHIDDHCGTAACASYAGGCFCEHCRAGFRAYLKAHYTPAQLAALGVPEVEQFDYLTSVRAVAPTREEYKKKCRSLPLYMPFMTFQAQAEAALVGEIRELVTKTRGRTLSFSANTGLPHPLHMADYRHLDTLCGEISLNAGAGKPSDVAHVAYKVADGLKRPLASTASGWDWAWVAAQNKPGLVKTWVAESYAFGNRLMAPHHQWCYTEQKGTHWWDGKTEDFAPLYQWISTHRELFDGFETAADVIVVFNSQAAYRGQDKHDEIGAWLAAHNVQYEMAIAGGEWVPERLEAEALLQAKQVIVSSRELLDEPQLQALEQVAQAGKLVAWKGAAAAEGLISRRVQVAGAENVWAVARRNEATGEVALHLLNRNYDLAQDKTIPTGPLTVTVDQRLLGPKTFTQAQLQVPTGGAPTAAVLQQEGATLRLQVPSVDLWSILILK